MTVPIKSNGHELGWVGKHGIEHERFSIFAKMYPDFPELLGSALGIERCFYCYPTRLQVEVSDDAVTVANPCQATEGVKIEFEVEFLSGRVVCDDSLHEVFPHIKIDTINYATGQRAWSLAEAQQGVALGSVGNTCPSIYRRADGTYSIATVGWKDDTQFDPEGEHLASICTDLWAYSLADYGRYLAYGGMPLGHPDWSWTRTVIDVEPGVYRFTHHACERGFDGDSVDPVIYAEFERI